MQVESNVEGYERSWVVLCVALMGRSGKGAGHRCRARTLCETDVGCGGWWRIGGAAAGDFGMRVFVIRGFVYLRVGLGAG